MNRAAVIDQLKQAREILAKLLALLEAGEADKFAAHPRREYRSACQQRYFFRGSSSGFT
jgi:hypothetical protein